MQCKCGGEATTSPSINKKLNAVYSYYLCKACGIASPATLHISDILVAHGSAAQAHYLNLDKTLATSLLAEAEADADTETATATPRSVTDTPQAHYTTGSLF